MNGRPTLILLLMALSVSGCRTSTEFESDYRAANLELGKRRDAQSRLIPEPRHILSPRDWARKFHPKNSRKRRLPAETIQRMERDYDDYTQRIRWNNDAAQARADAQDRRSVAQSLERLAAAFTRMVEREEDHFEQLAIALIMKGEEDNQVVKAWEQVVGLTDEKLLTAGDRVQILTTMSSLEAWIEAPTDRNLEDIIEILRAQGASERPDHGSAP